MLETLLALSLAQAAAAATASGQFLLNGQPISQVVARVIDYYGDCPGQGIERITGVSFLAPEAPGPYRRIVISNQTTGGFTDREYDERRPSAEAFVMASGQGQHGSFLSLAPGPNSFTYVVRDRVQNQVLGEGTAALVVNQERVSRQRSFSTINTDQYCLSTRSRDLSNCPNGLTTVERVGVCPDGSRRTLSLETVRIRS
jgi:hypothetical protein